MQNWTRKLLIVGIICSVLSMIAILLSYYYSGDTTQLFKAALPASILTILVFQFHQSGKSVP